MPTPLQTCWGAGERASAWRCSEIPIVINSLVLAAGALAFSLLTARSAGRRVRRWDRSDLLPRGFKRSGEKARIPGRGPLDPVSESRTLVIKPSSCSLPTGRSNVVSGLGLATLRLEPPGAPSQSSWGQMSAMNRGCRSTLKVAVEAHADSRFASTKGTTKSGEP